MAKPFLTLMIPRAVALLLMSVPALAAVIPETCTDGQGHNIAIEANYAQDQLVRTELRRKLPVIRYNPRVLPEMAPGTRLFFVAQACAQTSSAMDPPTHAQAYRADCVAYRMLKSNGLMSDAELADLARQLVFTSMEWQKLPGPPRGFDFTNCEAAGNVLRLPLATPPSAAQANWNACAHACGDRLWHCQQGGAHDTCLGSYDSCLKGCGEPPTATR